MKAVVRTNYFRAVTVVVAVAIAAMLVGALRMPAAQATTNPSNTIPSGTEVIPIISYDSNPASVVNVASSINLYDPVKRQSETISGPDGTDSFLWQPQLSEDGKKILFLDYHDYEPPSGDARQESIAFMLSNGGERTRIVTGEISTIGEYDLSRDGSKVLYQKYSYEDSRYHLFTAPVENNASPTEVPVPSNFPDVYDPIFNKEGTGIFFTGIDTNDPSFTDQLYYMNLDGTGVTKLTDFVIAHNPETGFTSLPAGYSPASKELSPDGNSIVYSGSLASDGTFANTGIYTLPVSGGTPQEVAVPSPGKDSTLGLERPHFNHDGSKIMYSQGHKLYSVSAANGKNKKLLLDGLEQLSTGNWEIVNK